MEKSRIGFVSISHPDYLEPMVYTAANRAAAAIEKAGFTLVRIEKPVADRQTAQKAGIELAGCDLAGVVLFLASWVECPVFMSVLGEIAHLPFCVWGFPMYELDGKLSSTGSYVSFAMLKGSLDRLELPYVYIIESADSPKAHKTLADFCAAAACRLNMRRSCIGLVGYTSMGIYPGTFDHLFLRAVIGPEVEQIDAYTLINLAKQTSESQKDEIIADYRRHACIKPDVLPEMLKKSAGLYAAMKTIAKEKNLAALNVKCQYELSKEYKMVPCVPLALLAENGVVTSCEGDMMNTVSMLLLHYLTGETVTYGDAMNRDGNTVLFSSCGFLPFGMGNPGEQTIGNFLQHPGFTGIQNCFVMRPGKVTLLRLVETRGGYKLLYFTGEGQKTELRQGYMPALNVLLDGSAAELEANYAGQHYAICYGDISDKIQAYAKIMKIDTIQII
jgi:L-fucose isomerase-like protein